MQNDDGVENVLEKFLHEHQEFFSLKDVVIEGDVVLRMRTTLGLTYVGAKSSPSSLFNT